MPVARFRASTFAQTVGTWANVANAVNAGDGTYATWTDATRRGTATGTFGGFDFSAIPAGSAINSVSAELRHYESSTADMGSVTVAGTAVTLATAARVDTVSLGTSLPSSVAVVATRANNTRSTTCYVDWLDVVVDYTEPVAPTVSLAADKTTIVAGDGVPNDTGILFTATATGFPAPSLSWDLGGGYNDDSLVELPGNQRRLQWTTTGAKTVTVTATNAAGSAQDSVQITVTEPVFASISTLKDNFASGHAGKWPGSYGTIATANSEAKITVASAVYGALFTDPTKYDCRNGEFFVRWRLPGPGAGGREFAVELRIDSNNFVQFYCIGYPSTLSAALRQGGVTSYPGQVALPGDTLWVKFSITNSVVTYSYSVNGIDWTTLGTASPSFNMNGLSVHMLSGAWQAEGTFDCVYGYVNTPMGAEVWNGTRWVPDSEMWNGTAWKATAEVWNGTRWVKLNSGATGAPAAPVAAFTMNFDGTGLPVTPGSWTEPMNVVCTSTSTGEITSYAWDFGASNYLVTSGSVTGPGPVVVQFFGNGASRNPRLTVTGPGGTDFKDFGVITTMGGPG